MWSSPTSSTGDDPGGSRVRRRPASAVRPPRSRSSRDRAGRSAYGSSSHASVEGAADDRDAGVPGLGVVGRLVGDVDDRELLVGEVAGEGQDDCESVFRKPTGRMPCSSLSATQTWRSPSTGFGEVILIRRVLLPRRSCTTVASPCAPDQSGRACSSAVHSTVWSGSTRSSPTPVRCRPPGPVRRPGRPRAAGTAGGRRGRCCGDGRVQCGHPSAARPRPPGHAEGAR